MDKGGRGCPGPTRGHDRSAISIWKTVDSFRYGHNNTAAKEERNIWDFCRRLTSVSIFALSFITVASGGGALMNSCRPSLGLHIHA